MNRISITCSILLFSLSCQSWAASSSIYTSTSTKKLYVGAGIGEMFYKVSGTNSLATGPGWPDDYYGNNNISNEVFGFIAAGYSWTRPNDWLPNYSLGLRYMFGSRTTVSGYIDQYSLSAFRNYNYSYDIKLQTLLALFKADIYRWKHVMPYVLVGAGITNYSSSNYTEQALRNVTPRVNPGFGNNSGNNFTYELGLGVDYSLKENFLINIEYDYIDYGTVSTGNGANYATLTGTNFANESLENKIKANTLFIGLTYYIK